MGTLSVGKEPVTGAIRHRRQGLDPIRWIVILFLVVCAVLSFFPFFLMISTSLKPVKEVFQVSTRLLPRQPIIDNYVRVFRESQLVRFLINGVIVTGGILLGQLLVIIPAAYAFARLSFPGKRVLFALVLAALVFPRYIAAVPNFLLLSKLKLVNTYPALILPFIGSSFGIFLMRQYFKQIPGEYFDAARIDGCNLFQMLTRVLIPLIRPAVGAFAIFSVVTHWNDFFWPLVVVQSANMYTPPAGIVYFADVEAGTNWSSVMSAAVVIITPLVAAFLLARRQFISSLTHAAIKG
ncbi:MAG: carbohydrate ABC transporter permease [Spirochaetales bacterium]|nr:carbohydrate ABC transporter permease [Spirochaetales bacterium]